jgi:hypothetical protein
MNTEHRIERNPRVVARELGEGSGGVLLHLDSGSYHGLSGVGWDIWGWIDGRRTARDMAAQCRARYADAPADIEEVVAAFVAGLRERDLVR